MFEDDCPIVRMSRRKQSRPQHLDREDEHMPKKDIELTQSEISVTFSSTLPTAVKSKEKIDSVEMTQTSLCENHLTHQESSAKAADDCTPEIASVEKMENNRTEITVSPRENSATIEDYHAIHHMDNAPTKSGKSASCGSLVSNIVIDVKTTMRHRRLSADAVDFSRVKIEPKEMNHESMLGSCARREDERSGSPGAKQASRNTLNSAANAETEYLRRVSCPARRYRSSEEDLLTKTSDKSDNTIQSDQNHHGAQVSAVFPERKYECQKCGVSFHKKNTYNAHVEIYCSGRRHNVECHICGAKFADDERLSVHMEDHSPHYICLLCGERFPQSEDCKNHMLRHAYDPECSVSHGKTGNWKCPSCEFQTSVKTNILSHLWTRHVSTTEWVSYPTGNVNSRNFRLPILSEQIRNISPRECGNKQKKKSDTNRRFSSPQRGLEKNNLERNEIEENDINNISPPKITSTPSRPRRSPSEEIDGKIFSCIVCSLGFPDVVSLQHHLLTSHASSQNTSNENPPGRPPNKKFIRTNSRKMSTVSPPQLSLLTSAAVTRKSNDISQITSDESIHNDLQNECSSKSLQQTNDKQYKSNINGESNSKKRKHRSNGSDSESSDMASPEQNTLKRVRRSADGFAKSRNLNSKLELSDARRMSCPVVSNQALDADILGISQARYIGNLLQERHCVECAITFANPVNFRAHKQHYCATRHIHKIQEDSNPDYSISGQQKHDDSPNANELLPPTKWRKRNVGNRSSITSRKRSHLIPLETVKDASQIESPPSDGKSTVPARKSTPSSIDMSTVARGSSGGGSSPDRKQNSPCPKKYLCMECNIPFSKFDTFKAHKTYYCESRRKDRCNPRGVGMASKMKRKSEPRIRDPSSGNDAACFPVENRLWSPNENSSSKEDEQQQQTPNENEDLSSQSLLNPLPSGTLPFASYNPIDHEMLTRLQGMFIHPLFFSQYVAMIRDRVAQGMCNNGFLIPGGQATKDPSFAMQGSLSRDASPKLHRRSADHIRLDATKSKYYRSIVPSQAPSSSAAVQNEMIGVIAVKQEPKDLQNNPSPSAVSNRGSPLDLSTKTGNSLTDNLPNNGEVEKSYPYPTIDLRTTALAIVKRESKNCFPGSNGELNASATTSMVYNDQLKDDCNTNNNNSGNSNDKTEANYSLKTSVVFPSQSQDGPTVSQKSRSQHCKNCDARFTNLSSFIAHKKYTCSASNSNGIHCNDTKAAQVAH